MSKRSPRRRSHRWSVGPRGLSSGFTALLALAFLAFGLHGPTPAEAAEACDRYASPSGSDAASGTADRPFATPQRLIDSLSAGETGCMREGTYQGNAVFRTGGSADERKTLQSYPGERAKVVGQVRVLETAAFVTIRALALDGSGAPRCASSTTCAVQASPWIQGDDTRVSDNDVTNRHSGICFLVGTSGRLPRSAPSSSTTASTTVAASPRPTSTTASTSSMRSTPGSSAT